MKEVKEKEEKGNKNPSRNILMRESNERERESTRRKRNQRK